MEGLTALSNSDIGCVGVLSVLIWLGGTPSCKNELIELSFHTLTLDSLVSLSSSRASNLIQAGFLLVSE